MTSMTAATNDAALGGGQARDAAADGAFVYSVRDHRGLLPAVLRRAPAAARERRLSTTTCAEAERGGLPALQALPAGPSRPGRAPRRGGGRRLPADRERPRSRRRWRRWPRRRASAAYHFHRLFKAVTGLTPKAYAAAPTGRGGCGRSSAGRRTVTAAIYEAGYNSSGRFYEHARRASGHDADAPTATAAADARSASPSASARWAPILVAATATRRLRDPARRRSGRAGARSAGPLPEGAS